MVRQCEIKLHITCDRTVEWKWFWCQNVVKMVWIIANFRSHSWYRPQKASFTHAGSQLDFIGTWKRWCRVVVDMWPWRVCSKVIYGSLEVINPVHQPWHLVGTYFMHSISSLCFKSYGLWSGVQLARGFADSGGFSSSAALKLLLCTHSDSFDWLLSLIQRSIAVATASSNSCEQGCQKFSAEVAVEIDKK